MDHVEAGVAGMNNGNRLQLHAAYIIEIYPDKDRRIFLLLCGFDETKPPFLYSNREIVLLLSVTA